MSGSVKNSKTQVREESAGCCEKINLIVGSKMQRSEEPAKAHGHAHDHKDCSAELSHKEHGHGSDKHLHREQGHVKGGHAHEGCSHEHSHTDEEHDHGEEEHSHGDHQHKGCNHDHAQDDQADEHHGHSGDCCSGAPTNLSNLGGSKVVAGGLRTEIRIMQMDCPVEENLIKKKLGAMTSVKELDFNLMQRVLTVTHTPDSLEPILVAIRSLGFVPEVSDNNGEKKNIQEKKKPWWPLALAGVAALAAEVMHWADMPDWLEAGLALIAVLLSGLTTYKKGWISIRNGNLNINALMSIAVTGALVLVTCSPLISTPRC